MTIYKNMISQMEWLLYSLCFIGSHHLFLMECYLYFSYLGMLIATRIEATSEYLLSTNKNTLYVVNLCRVGFINMHLMHPWNLLIKMKEN